MANSMQLKFLIKYGRSFFTNFYSIQMGLGIASVILAAFIGRFLYFGYLVNFSKKSSSFLNGLIIQQP
jgi:hypothetical protein